jgi:hypothetical protein
MPRAAAVKLFKSNTVNYLKEDDLLFLRDFVVSTATSTNKLKACGTFNFSLAVSVIKRQ